MCILGACERCRCLRNKKSWSLQKKVRKMDWRSLWKSSLTVKIEVNFHPRSMTSSNKRLEDLFVCNGDFWSLCSQTESESVDYPDLQKICQTRNTWQCSNVHTCHINGIFLMFPSRRKTTINLHIVTSDQICERMEPRWSPAWVGGVKPSYRVEFMGTLWCISVV